MRFAICKMKHIFVREFELLITIRKIVDDQKIDRTKNSFEHSYILLLQRFAKQTIAQIVVLLSWMHTSSLERRSTPPLNANCTHYVQKSLIFSVVWRKWAFDHKLTVQNCWQNLRFFFGDFWPPCQPPTEEEALAEELQFLELIFIERTLW